MKTASKLAFVAAGIMGLLMISPVAFAKPNMGDLSELPGCAGQCHVNGGFKVDKKTGEKIEIKQKKDDDDDDDGPICKTRTKCGPAFCTKRET